MINRRKKEVLRLEILRILKGNERPVSTQELADKLKGKPWHSVHTRCLMLQVEGLVEGFRVGRMNLWQISKKGKGGKNG
jgi:DNA-binding IclR family transcriptional regulator